MEEKRKRRKKWERKRKGELDCLRFSFGFFLFASFYYDFRLLHHFKMRKKSSNSDDDPSKKPLFEETSMKWRFYEWTYCDLCSRPCELFISRSQRNRRGKTHGRDENSNVFTTRKMVKKTHTDIRCSSSGCQSTICKIAKTWKTGAYLKESICFEPIRTHFRPQFRPIRLNSEEIEPIRMNASKFG